MIQYKSCSSLLRKVNEVNAYGNTPLHLACYNGQDVVVSELIQAGAKVNQVCVGVHGCLT